jgi:uncharacterized membrane protein YgcG
MKEPQMRNRRLLTITFATSSIVAVSGIAFAVVQSVDATPAPQVVIPASSSHSVSHTARTPERGDDNGAIRTRGADDPATHDAGDDTSDATTGTDDPATHDAGDDNGGTTTGTDDPATHDADDDTSGTTSGGDSGSGSGSGSGGGGDDSGSGGHGSDG